MIKPLGSRVVIEPLKEEKMTESGIVIPDSAEKRPIKGRVVAVGEGKINDKGERQILSVKEGDTVLFKEYGPEKIKIGERELLIADEEDILGIFE